MKPIRVLIVTTLFPRWKDDYRGPIIWQIAKSLVENNIDVTVISMHGPESRKFEMLEGIKIYRPRYIWPSKFEILQETGGGLPAAWEKKPITRLLFPLLLLAQTIAIIKQISKFDVIHAQFTLSAMAAKISRIFHNKPIVATVRGSDIYRIPLIPFGKLFNKIALSSCDVITVMSRDLQRELEYSLNIPPAKINYAPPPINKQLFWPTNWEERENIILSVGALIPRKGTVNLIEAFAKVTGEFSNYQLIIVGRGPQERHLKNKIIELNLSKSVTIIPELSQIEIAELLRKSKLFVLPSTEEALGMVAVEALASGTPVIASKVGGIPDIINNKVGVLVPPGDSNSLLKAIKNCLSDEILLKDFSHNALEHVNNQIFSHSQNSKYLQQIYKTVIPENNLKHKCTHKN